MRKPLELLARRHPSKLPVVIIAGDLNFPQIGWEFQSAPDGPGVLHGSMLLFVIISKYKTIWPSKLNVSGQKLTAQSIGRLAIEKQYSSKQKTASTSTV